MDVMTVELASWSAYHYIRRSSISPHQAVGCDDLVSTIYLTNTAADMLKDMNSSLERYLEKSGHEFVFSADPNLFEL